jgi:hypothetical protein
VFFGYPIAATTENWLHECLCEIIQIIHASLDANQTLPSWPDIIPESSRARLTKRDGLQKRLNAYHIDAAKLTQSERQKVSACLTQQNRISELCNCSEDCETLDEMPIKIQASIKSLFDFAFSLLEDFGIRDRQYSVIYESQTYHVCPFCGCEYFDAPGAPREDLDHYLVKNKYPFAAVNLRNLVPMGMKCNQRYKHEADMLRDAQGFRRLSFDPYTERNLEVRLTNSVPFAGLDGQPQWNIDIQPDSPECTTWDDVFSLRKRMIRDVLDPSFNRWLGEFAKWFCKRNPYSDDFAIVLKELSIYAEDFELLGFDAREFLRVPVFNMLHHHCANGDERLSEFIVSLISITGSAR